MTHCIKKGGEMFSVFFLFFYLVGHGSVWLFGYLFGYGSSLSR